MIIIIKEEDLKEGVVGSFERDLEVSRGVLSGCFWSTPSSEADDARSQESETNFCSNTVHNR